MQAAIGLFWWALVMLMCLVALCVGRGYLYYRQCGGKAGLLRSCEELKAKAGYRTFEQLNDTTIGAILLMEDHMFYQHRGINWKFVKIALKINYKNKKIVMGGSTVSQQLCKNIMFHFDRTFKRKIAEVFAVRVLEKHYTKEEIIALYLNCIEYGKGQWGIADACKYYMDKSPEELDLGQAISLFALLPAPNRFNPIDYEEKFYEVRADRVDKLVRRGALRTKDAERIKNSAAFEAVIAPAQQYNYTHWYRLALVRCQQEHTEFAVRPLTEEGLAMFVQVCEKKASRYLWGGLMQPITAEGLARLKQAYPQWYTEEKLHDLQQLVGKDVYGTDCSGLIKRYLFGGMDTNYYIADYDYNTHMLLTHAWEKGDIETLPEQPGVCLYMPGHVGVYVGNGEVVESTMNPLFGDGVVRTKKAAREWTHWFHCPGIIREDV